ncbi:unnamed protein product [Gordionus sp. m RMFG-2023]
MKAVVLILMIVNLIFSANGETFKKRDNEMSVSTQKCPPVCLIYCPFGNVLDVNGCPTCKCKSPKCPPVCLIYCPFGNVLDVNGCPTCKCKPNPNCPPVCKIYCEFGNVLDANDCPICKCKPNPKCAPVCKIFCLFGNVLDGNGCPICECNKEPRNMLALPDPSQSGRSSLISNALTVGNTDAMEMFYVTNGCPTCKCNTDPGNLASSSYPLQGGRSGVSDALTARVNPAAGLMCPSIMCFVCPYGNNGS